MKYRSTILIPACFALLAGQAVHAGAAPPPNMSGVAEFQIGYLDSDFFGFSDNGNFLGGQLQFNFPLRDSWGMQFDLYADRYDLNTIVLDAKSWGLGGHLYKSLGDVTYGASLSYGDTDVNGFSFDHWSLGLEGKWFSDKTALLGQFGYTDYDDFSGIDSGWYARGKLDYYYGQNLKFYGGLGLADYDFVVGPGNLDITGGEIGVEYKPGNGKPYVLFGELSMYKYDFGGLTDLDMRKASIGLKYYFGDAPNSIQENDKNATAFELPMRIGLRHSF